MTAKLNKMNGSDIFGHGYNIQHHLASHVPGVEAGGISICPEGNSDHSEFPDLCEKGGAGVACRSPAGLLGGRTEMAVCHQERANFCPGD